jgi:DNA polymerase III gamma/tau subunit
MIKTLQHAEGEMRRAPQPRFLLEMALIRLTEIRRVQALDEILGKLVALEGRLPGGPAALVAANELPLFGGRQKQVSAERSVQSMPGVEAPPSNPDARPSPEVGKPDDASNLAVEWAAVVGRLRGRKRLASVLTEVRPAALTAETLSLEVKNGNAFIRDTLEDPDTRKLIADAAAESLGRRLRIEYHFAAPSSPGAELAEPRRAPIVAPRLRDHPLVRDALSMFGGTIVHEISP